MYHFYHSAINFQFYIDFDKKIYYNYRIILKGFTIMDKLLELLESNAKLSVEQLAVMLDESTNEIEKRIREYENSGTILGYKTLIDWDKTEKEYVTAMIELRVTPERDRGFDRIAKRVSSFDEVKNVYLASGGFDLCLFVEGRTMRDVAFFVSSKLSTIEGITSTATHFIMKKYKDMGESSLSENDNGRMSCL